MNRKNRFALAAVAAALVATSGVAAQTAQSTTRSATAQRAAPPADITRAQWTAEAEQRFARMDANGDGRLTAEDRTALHQQRRAAQFARLDADSNGSISRAEWDNARQPGGERGAEAGQRRGPGMGEGRGPGRRHFGHGERAGAERGMPGERAGQPREIDRAAFLAASAARFDRLDKDSNGIVTAAERRADRTERRAERPARGADRPAPAAPTTNR